MRAWVLAVTCFPTALLLAYGCTGDEPQVVPTATLDGAAAPSPNPTGTNPDPAPPGIVDAGADAAFCATRSAPPDASDFYCADFDGEDIEAGFKGHYVEDGGALLPTDTFFSKPHALETKNGFVYWQASGGASITAVDLALEIHAVPPGGLTPTESQGTTIFELLNGSQRLEFRYAHGASFDPSYTGYYFDVTDCPDPCYTVDQKKTPDLAANQWTHLALHWTTSGITIDYGTEHPPLVVNALGGTDLSFQLGSVVLSGAAVPPALAFDNVTLAITR